MNYDWAGTRILQEKTALMDKRRVYANTDTHVLTDLREWVTPGDREQIRRTLHEIKLPKTRNPGTFDRRAWILWKWVMENITYVPDPEEQKLVDYWQFPAETLAVRRGDCEDFAFLLGSLLLGSGISSYCVRVVIGEVMFRKDLEEHHAWVVYKNEKGHWCLLESARQKDKAPRRFTLVESCTRDKKYPRYKPILCLNAEHVWEVAPIHTVGNTENFLKKLADRKYLKK